MKKINLIITRVFVCICVFVGVWMCVLLCSDWKKIVLNIMCVCLCLCKCVFVGVEPESESHLCLPGDSQWQNNLA